MASTYPAYYDGADAVAIPVPAGKDQYEAYYQGHENTYSVSPPEADLSVSDGSSPMLPSYSNSSYCATTSSYAGSSQGDYDSTGSASGIDFNEYMQERFAETFNPLPLDRCMAVQAQTSGHLNATQRDLLELQAKAQARLEKCRARFAKGLEDAREVHADLEWTQKKVSSLKSKASKKHSKEYKKARARYPSPEC
ncbi:hypothetical protein VTK73DRAFT_8498 [Phialemonium thermophilum]|uniref:Biogenesis of lysosome-related organelles complex 1 subunit KXD1 n=1 Tax=Phialemonium thermophilum TaxID=223376 RepID=A0ABR3XPE5_9PEZI